MNLSEAFNQTFSGTSAKQPKKSDRIQQATPLNMRGAFEAATNIPVVGDALSGGMAVYDAVKGDYPSAAMNALGVLPFVSGTFIGKSAKTWDAVKAAEAEKRLAAGDDVRKVWKETGTFKGPDGHLRQEIDDSNVPQRMYMSEDALFKYPTINQSLPHKRLYKAYPDTADIRLAPVIGKEGGHYDEAQNVIGLKPIAAGNTTPEASRQITSTQLHELQHAIQQREGWARGGSPEMISDELSGDAIAIGKRISDIRSGIEKSDFNTLMQLEAQKKALDHDLNFPFDAYKRLAGEAESRLTQARINLSPEQRLAQYPYDPEYFKQATGVDINNLIVRSLLK